MAKIIHELDKAISAVCLQKFVYITWSHDQNLFTKVMTRIIQGHLCLEKAYKAIFDEIRRQQEQHHFTGNANFKSVEARAMLLAPKK